MRIHSSRRRLLLTAVVLSTSALTACSAPATTTSEPAHVPAFDSLFDMPTPTAEPSPTPGATPTVSGNQDQDQDQDPASDVSIDAKYENHHIGDVVEVAGSTIVVNSVEEVASYDSVCWNYVPENARKLYVVNVTVKNGGDDLMYVDEYAFGDERLVSWYAVDDSQMSPSQISCLTDGQPGSGLMNGETATWDMLVESGSNDEIGWMYIHDFSGSRGEVIVFADDLDVTP